MAITRFRQGDVTVTLTGDLEAFARRAVDAAAGETVRLMEGAANGVRSSAAGEWYRRVERETGKSGDIDVVTTIDVNRSEVRVSIGSTDERVVLAKKRNKDGTITGTTGKPVPVFVHSPGPGALAKVQVTHDEYWDAPKSLRSNYKPIPPNPKTGWKGDEGTGPYMWKVSPLAGDGKFLLGELVKAPMRRVVKQITPELGRSIAARINGGARG